MPPKKRGAKKTKSALSRNRKPKQEDEEESAPPSVAGDEATDDNVSEAPPSPVAGTSKAATAVVEDKTEERKVARMMKSDEEDSDEDKSWKDVPDLTAELRRGSKVTYVTKTRMFRQWELDARNDLLKDMFELEHMKQTLDGSLRAMRNLHKDVKNGRVADVIGELHCNGSLADLMIKLADIPPPVVTMPSRIHMHEPIFEESETELEEAMALTSLESRRFPSPAKMARLQTPKNQGPSVFHFGTHSKALSTNKAPRMAKPGEVVYSQSGSPIMQRRLPDNTIAPQERIELIQPDGSKIEVDIVYRGDTDGSKLRGFKEFAKDIKGIAASRSTSVRQNRIQPPKIPVKVGSQSASKSKPGWR